MSPRAPRPGPARPRPSILVVEDEDAVREVILEFLARSGFEGRGLSTGGDALKRLAEDAAAPDLVLLDWSLPGVSGADLYSAIRDRWPFTEVVVLSGRPRAELRLRGPAPALILQKPIGMRPLIQAIRSVLDGEPTETGAARESA
jgi:DNA-binding response OmpR family regulator